MNFLKRMHEKEKLSLIEPRLLLKQAYLQRSEQSLSSAKALLEIGNLEDSIVLSYYAMYHCLLALLFRTGIKCENHTAAIILLKTVFGKDNSKIKQAKTDRIDNQYFVNLKAAIEEAEQAISSTEDFIAELTDFIERLNEQEIIKYRQNYIKLFL